LNEVQAILNLRLRKRYVKNKKQGTSMAQISKEVFDHIIKTELPWAEEIGMSCDTIKKGRAILRLPFNDKMLRPGGTVSGPTMMALADACMYAVVLSAIGPVKLAVTTNFNINFMHRPAPADLMCEGKILKLGKRLCVMDVTLYSEGHDDPVAHATGTYSIPADRK
jgi:uncharacterized protein (TIGR00369 family)